MTWMQEHAAPDARVLVLTDVPWQIDKVSEWFPALASRHSVATVQGREWLAGDAFAVSIGQQRRLAECAGRDTSCLDQLRVETGLAFTHVYAPATGGRSCCTPLVASLGRDPRYALVFANRAASIFELSIFEVP
jgi:hypothetical protein